MAVGQSGYTRWELALMMAGFLQIPDEAKRKTPNQYTPNKYWYKSITTGGEATTYPSLDVNWDWFGDPGTAAKNVPHRSFLVAAFFMNGLDREFMSLPSAPDGTLDIMKEEIGPDLLGQHPELKAVLDPIITADGLSRNMETALTLGFTQATSGSDSLLVIGGGFRKRTKTFTTGTETEALQLDIELYAPFIAINMQDGSLAEVPAAAAKMQMGLALSRQGNAIGTHGAGTSKTGLRCSVALNFQPGGAIDLGKPLIQVQECADTNSERWEQGTMHWDAALDEAAIKALIADINTNLLWNTGFNFGQAMWKAPLGPISVQMLKYFHLVQMKRKKGEGENAPDGKLRPQVQNFRKQMKTYFGHFQTDKKAAGDYLNKLNKNSWRTDKVEAPVPSNPILPKEKTEISYITVDSFLIGIGLLYEKKGGARGDSNPILTIVDLDKLKQNGVFPMINAMINLFDGFPIFIKSQSMINKNDAKDKNKKYSSTRAEAQLAAVTDETTIVDPKTQKHHFGLRFSLADVLFADNKDFSAMFQLGKWLSGESEKDNWFRRLMPTINPSSVAPAKPVVGHAGLGVYPFSMTVTKNADDTFSGTFANDWRLDLISMGLDLTFKSPKILLDLKRLGLAIGGAEIRVATGFEPANITQANNKVIAVGVKLNNIELDISGNFQRAQEPDDEDQSEEDEMINAIFQAFSQLHTSEETQVQAGHVHDKSEDQPRNSAVFSVSGGYLYSASKQAFDFQLYDAKGAKGEIVWIPIDFTINKKNLDLKIDSVGIGLKKVELQDPELTVLVKGSLHFDGFWLDLMGAGVGINFVKKPDRPTVYLIIKGLSVQLEFGPVFIEGGFLTRRTNAFEFVNGAAEIMTIKSGPNKGKPVMITQYAGSLKISIKRGGKAWFGLTAMGAYGDMGKNGGKSFFIFAALTFPKGGGIGNAIIKITGIAGGYGYNRMVIAPTITEVGSFPFVSMVMGKGELSKYHYISTNDVRNHVSKDVDPGEILVALTESVLPALGQQFACVGLRFTLVSAIDCFLLAIVQWGHSWEVDFLGVARFKEPMAGQAICYIELDMVGYVKPDSFSIVAQLSDNSWLMDTSCQLTGGFALDVWYGDSPYAHDFVLTVGGYHPRFTRPAHYPIVPRLGFNWEPTDELSIKGGMYIAITPKAFMAGASLEATFSAGPVSATFKAYLDALIEWCPTHYDVSMGIYIDFALDIGITTVHLGKGIELQIIGPPIHGYIKLRVLMFKVKIPFGETPAGPKLLGSWERFGRNFIDREDANGKKVDGAIEGPGTDSADKFRTPAAGAPVTPGPKVSTVSLLAGELVTAGAGDKADVKKPGTHTKISGVGLPPKPAVKDKRWFVRADEVEFAVNTVVPAKKLIMFKSAAGGSGDPAYNGKIVHGVQHFSNIDQWMGVAEDLELLDVEALVTNKPDIATTTKLTLPVTAQSDNSIGARLMGVSSLESVLKVAIVYEVEDNAHKTCYEQRELLDLRDWTVEVEKSGMPGALWDVDVPDLATGPTNPDAKMIHGCVTGLKSLKPPTSKPEYPLGTIKPETWMKVHDILEDRHSIPATGTSGALHTAASISSAQSPLKGASAARAAIFTELKKDLFNVPAYNAAATFHDLYAVPMAETA